MAINFNKGVTDLENVIFVCFGAGREDDFPVRGRDAVIVDLARHRKLYFD
jgi:hypothetical protein